MLAAWVRREEIKEAWEQGRAEGREQGRAEGREQGLAEARAEGREQGRAEGRVVGRAEGRAVGIAEGRAEEREVWLDWHNRLVAWERRKADALREGRTFVEPRPALPVGEYQKVSLG